MKAKFFGIEYPVVNITFASGHVIVTYLDEASSGPLKTLTMSEKEFRNTVAFVEA